MPGKDTGKSVSLRLMKMCIESLFFLLFVVCPVISDGVEPASPVALPTEMSYQQYVTLIHEQSDNDGCIGYSSTHILEILKEMEAPYTPDPSYGFHEYVWTSATEGINQGITDPRVAHDPNIESTYDIMMTYGAPSETSYPTNYDIMGGTYKSFLQHPPEDSVFTEALNYRTVDLGTTINNPSLTKTLELLANEGPLLCNELLEGHAVALIGYDMGKEEFTVVDSANWQDIKHSGIKKVPFSTFEANQENISIGLLKNRPSKLIHPYTARIKVTHPYRRSMLTVRIGVESEDELVTVWDQNNLVQYPDKSQDLWIDVPLPDYASKYWPVSETNKWAIQVENHDPVTEAELQEVILIKRDANPDGSYAGTFQTYQMGGLPRNIPPGITNCYIPVGITVTYPDKHVGFQEGKEAKVEWKQTGLSGTDVKIELIDSSTNAPVSTLAPKIGVNYNSMDNTPYYPGGEGWYSFTVPTGLEKKKDYYVRISSLNYPEISDDSGGTVAIVGEPIKLVDTKKISVDPIRTIKIPDFMGNTTDLVISDVKFTRKETIGKPDVYELTISVKNEGGLPSDPTNVGFISSWIGYEAGVTTDVLKPYIDVPSIPGGETVTVKKSFEEDKTGKITICYITVNVPEPDCFGDDCIPAEEFKDSNNQWPGCYTIPDKVNSTLQTVSVVSLKDKIVPSVPSIKPFSRA